MPGVGAGARLGEAMTPTRTRSSVSPAFLAIDPAELRRGMGEVGDPVLRVVLDRVRAGSRPGARSDDHVVCLAVEGGGLRGAVSAGMCVVLEAAGLVPAFDRVYGVSAGALNASAVAMGQAALGATHYQDAASRRVINPARPLVGRPVVDYDFLFGELIGTRKPLSFAGLRDGPEFRALATSLDALELRVLADFVDLEELMQGVRASAAIPRLGGRPPVFRGERMADGGLIEAIPYATALREGATHVLVLRSRPAGYRKPAVSSFAERLGARGDAALDEIAHTHRNSYNRQAAELEEITRPDGDPRVAQVAVPDGTRLIGRLETNPARVVDALRVGAAAMAGVILDEPVELCWQPVAYRTAPAAPPETRRVPASVRWRPSLRRAPAPP